MVKKFPIGKKASNSRMATPRQASKAKSAKADKLHTVKFLIIVGSIIIAIAASILPYVWIEKSEQQDRDLMPIRVLEIEGRLTRVTREQITAKIINASESTDHNNKNTEQKEGVIGYFGSDLQELEARLHTLAWVQKIELRRVWPDRLRIVIKEHKAIARWNDEQLINEFGELFSPPKMEGFEYLPQLNGPDPDLHTLLVTFQELQQLLTMSELQLEVLSLNHRFSWSMRLSNGIKLQIGRKHLLERVERFIALYPLLQRERDLPIEKIDLRYDTGLAVTWLETTERQASL